MILKSTRNMKDIRSFGEAIFIGLAPDGGLYYPSKDMDISDILAESDESTPFNELAEKLTTRFLEDEISKKAASRIVKNAFYFEPKLHRIKSNLDVLELFHGGTCAFKDFGASFLASAMEEFLKDRKAVILTATSGDTGSAVARAFYQKKNIDVVILYPSGRVSPLQEKQLTTLGSNIHALEVDGSFDDCQRMVKEAFNNQNLKEEYKLSSANSINIGRLFPQSFYYIWAYLQRKKTNPNPVFCVPSGNFGNLTAGLYAAKWGLPVKKFIASTNSNDVIPKYLEDGIYTPRASVATYSNAMDVGAPSNFERMEQLFNKNVHNFNSKIVGHRVSDDETASTMKNIYNSYNYLACPHTAVGIKASEEYLKSNPTDHIITLSTAHPGKFLEVSQEILGVTPELPKRLKDLQDKEKKAQKISSTLDDLTVFLKDTF